MILRLVWCLDESILTVANSVVANRVMVLVTKCIEKKLELKVNATKFKVIKPTKLKYLGFGFWKRKESWKAREHENSL